MSVSFGHLVLDRHTSRWSPRSLTR